MGGTLRRLYLAVAHHPRLPQPPGAAWLRALRERVTDDLLAEHRLEVAGVAELWRDGQPERRERLRGLVDRLVTEHRRRVVAEARGPVERPLALLDARLPTDETELMDREDFPRELRERSLQHLDRTIHRVVGSYERAFALVLPWVEAAAGGGAPGSVLDIASGHGGFPVALWTLARRHGLALDVTASDLSADYLRGAADKAARAGVPLATLRLDALAPDLSAASFDIVTCTNSLHHFGAGGIAVLYAEAARIARRGVVFLDPCRASTFGVVAAALYTATGGPRAGTHDAWLTIRKALVPEEVRLLAACTPGAERAQVRWVPPVWWAMTGPAAG